MFRSRIPARLPKNMAHASAFAPARSSLLGGTEVVVSLLSRPSCTVLFEEGDSIFPSSFVSCEPCVTG